MVDTVTTTYYDDDTGEILSVVTTSKKVDDRGGLKLGDRAGKNVKKINGRFNPKEDVIVGGKKVKKKDQAPEITVEGKTITINAKNRDCEVRIYPVVAENRPARGRIWAYIGTGKDHVVAVPDRFLSSYQIDIVRPKYLVHTTVTDRI